MLLALILALAAEARPPNVVFILADDLGWKDLGYAGSKFHRTPNLDKLAARSVRLANHYSASPLCSPTRSSILCGLYPARTGITAPVCHLPQVQLVKRLAPGGPQQRVLNADSVTRLKGEYVTMAEILKGAGYATAHFGKWHLGHGAGYEPKDQGFDVDLPHTPRAAGPGGGYHAPWKFAPEAKPTKPNEHIDSWMADRAGEFIAANKTRPFYVNFWAYSVHGPWNADPAVIEQYQKSADPKAGQRNPLYAAMVQGLDDAVGKLMGALDAAGVAENTIVVFTGDNGGWAYPPRQTEPPGYENIPATSNAPARSGKASCYDGGTRVPCLWSWPAKLKPADREQLSSSVDFLPTLLEMTGVKAPPALKPDGLSQAAALIDGKPCRQEVFVHFPHGGAAQEANIPGFWPGAWVRQGDRKLLRFFAKNDDGSDRHELYDLAADPGESKDLAAERPAEVKELAARLEAYLTGTNAVIPTRNPNYNPNAPAAKAKGKGKAKAKAAAKEPTP